MGFREYLLAFGLPFLCIWIGRRFLNGLVQFIFLLICAATALVVLAPDGWWMPGPIMAVRSDVSAWKDYIHLLVIAALGAIGAGAALTEDYDLFHYVGAFVFPFVYLCLQHKWFRGIAALFLWVAAVALIAGNIAQPPSGFLSIIVNVNEFVGSRAHAVWDASLLIVAVGSISLVWCQSEIGDGDVIDIDFDEVGSVLLRLCGYIVPFAIPPMYLYLRRKWVVATICLLIWLSMIGVLLVAQMHLPGWTSTAKELLQSHKHLADAIAATSLAVMSAYGVWLRRKEIILAEIAEREAQRRSYSAYSGYRSSSPYSRGSSDRSMLSR